MKKEDLIDLFLYALITALVVMILTSCHASRKNVSIAKVHTDSAVQISKKQTASATLDSTGKKIKNTEYVKVTEITYTPFDSAGKIIFIPHILIKESGTQTKQQESHLQKKDTTAREVKKDIRVKKEVKSVEKKKVKVGFNMWWLLALLPLLLLMSKKVRSVLYKLFINPLNLLN